MIKSLIRYWRIIVLHGVLAIIPKLSIQSWSRVLIVAPHPDDEVLGCAGLIQRLLWEGKHVDVVILSGGGKSHAGCCQVKESLLINSRRDLSRKAADLLELPLKNLHFLNYPDGSISFDCSETVQLKNLIEELQPDTIFVPHKGEGWSDHVKTGSIVKELLPEKVPVYEYCVWLWYYNVWGLDWKNARRLKMTAEEHLLKLRAINQYVTPLAPCGKPWSGVLPRILLKANQNKTELYFKVR